MRTPPRKLRPFRPSALALEAICPVSSLATALPLAASALVGESGTSQAHHQEPAWDTSRRSCLVVSQPQAETLGGSISGAGQVLARASLAAMTMDSESAPAVDLGRYHNSITIVSAKVPLTRQSSAPAQGPSGGGGVSGPGQPTTRSTSSNGAAPPPSAVSQFPSSTNPVASSANGGSGSIRPMTLAPSVLSAQGSPASTSGKSGASNFASPMDNPSGGGIGPVPVITDNAAPDLIGGHANFSVAPPSGSTLSITHVDWNLGNMGACSGQKTPDIADKQFIYYPILDSALHGTSVDFYWMGSGGTDEITAAVTYSDGSANSQTLYVNIYTTAMTLNLSTRNFTQGYNLPDPANPGSTIPIIVYGDYPSSTNGVRWSLSDSYGSVNVVQNVTFADMYESSDPNLPPVTTTRFFVYRDPTSNQIIYPTPLVDTGATSGTPFYPFSGDSPQIGLRAGMTYARWHLNFKDYAMFKPTGGIWVPHSSWTWDVDARAVLSGATWTSSDVSQPGYNGDFALDGTYPSWVDPAEKYIPNPINV